MKAQLLISLESKMIYGITSGKGKTHDFKMFKDSKVHIPSDIGILGDSGYQGIKDIHANSRTPIKKPKGKKLTRRQKLYNHLISKNLFKVFLICYKDIFNKLFKNIYA